MRDDKECLLDILEAIENIERYTQERNAFEKEELFQVWTIHHIQIIGEATARLSENLRDNYPEIPWPQIISMRSIIGHHYFSVDTNEIWSTVERDLPKLKDDVKKFFGNINLTNNLLYAVFRPFQNRLF